MKVIRRIKRDSAAASFEPPNQMLAPGMVLTKVQGVDVQAEELAATLGRIETAALPIELVFAAGVDGSMPHVVAVETPRDAYGFPFAIGRGTGSGYFHTSPRTHRRIDAEVQTKSVSRKARKRVETQEKKWQRWLEEPERGLRPPPGSRLGDKKGPLGDKKQRPRLSGLQAVAEDEELRTEDEVPVTRSPSGDRGDKPRGTASILVSSPGAASGDQAERLTKSQEQKRYMRRKSTVTFNF